MALHRVEADHQRLGDPRVALARRDKAQDFDLAGGKAVWRPSAPWGLIRQVRQEGFYSANALLSVTQRVASIEQYHSRARELRYVRSFLGGYRAEIASMKYQRRHFQPR